MTTTSDTIHHPTAMLDTGQAADVLGLRPQTLHEWRTRRVGPPWAKMGRAVRYRYADLLDYIEAQRITPSA